jgi:hypothetical protein
MVSLVALAIYFVFFGVSSAVAAVAVIAATIADADADAEFLAGAAAAAAASLYDDGFDLLIVTGVQSWQSGVGASGVLYRFR